MKLLAAALLMLALALPARADISFERLAELVAMPTMLEGSFRQQKFLASFDTSLASSGSFRLQRGESVHWHIDEPIKNELVITPAGMSSRQGDSELLRLDADSSPAVALMGEVMFALISADWPTLARYFELAGSLDGGSWQAQLKPRDVLIGELFARIDIEGGALPRRIVIYENGGDITTIELNADVE